MVSKRALISRKSLSSGEQIVFETRQSAWLCMKTAVLALVLFFVSIILYVWTLMSSAPSIPWLTDAVNNHSYGKYVQWALLIIAILALLFAFVKYLRWGSTVYASTNERIITKRGILSKTYEDMPLRMITNIDLGQTLAERGLGYGTIMFSTQGLSEGGGRKKADVVWTGVPNPMNVRKMLQEALDSRFRGKSSDERDAPPAPSPPKKENT
jgi:membrane protein YdbS with pleckstrin-like domain